MSATFRKIDVDAFDEDQYDDDLSAQPGQLQQQQSQQSQAASLPPSSSTALLGSPPLPLLTNIAAQASHPRPRPLQEEELQKCRAEVTSHLSKQNISSALLSVLQRVLGTSSGVSGGGITGDDVDIKESYARLVLDTLTQSTQTSTASNLAMIGTIVKSLDAPLQDTLMKFVYFLMSRPEWGSSCAVLLQWHEKCFEVGGAGCIVRCMTDRSRFL